jgi:disulfide bond formation protein DsbB
MPANQPKKQPDYLSRSIQMAVVMGGCAFGGFQSDKALGLRFPIFTLVLSLIGVALGIYIFVRDSK